MHTKEDVFPSLDGPDFFSKLSVVAKTWFVDPERTGQNWNEWLPQDLADAHPRRQKHAAAARYCANRAYMMWGNSKPIHVQKDGFGAPQWPKGYLGSLTHTDGFAAACLARSKDYVGVGIDSERLQRVKDYQKLLRAILVPSELELWRSLPWPGGTRTTFFFSAKESIFKALAPLCGGRFFGFSSARIETVCKNSGHFQFVLNSHFQDPFRVGWQGTGFFDITHSFVHTAVLIPTGNTSNSRCD